MVIIVAIGPPILNSLQFMFIIFQPPVLRILINGTIGLIQETRRYTFDQHRPGLPVVPGQNIAYSTQFFARECIRNEKSPTILSLAKPKYKTTKILNTYELFMYGYKY